MSEQKSIRRLIAFVAATLILSAVYLKPSTCFSQSGPTNLATRESGSEFKRRAAIEYLGVAEKKLEEFQTQKKEIEKRYAELNGKYQSSLEKNDGISVSTESYTAIIQTLQSQKVELLVDIAGMEAREKTIRKIRDEMESEGKEIITQLEKLVEIQKSNLQSVTQRYKVAAAPKTEVNSAESKLLEVEIRLAEAKQRSQSSAYLNDFYVKSSLDQAEKKARLEMTESLLASFAQSRTRLEEQISIQNQYTNSKMQLEMIKNNINLYEKRVDGLKKDVSELDTKLKSSGDQDEN